MNYTFHKSIIRSICQGDPDFMLHDGMVISPRAHLQIMSDCPDTIKTSILWALSNGYLKCVANVKDHELMWDQLHE
jgi:hypothetical protein